MSAIVSRRWGVPTQSGGGRRVTLSPPSSVLKAGQALLRGAVLWSPDGRFYATVQVDGNFVIYDTAVVDDSGDYLAIFASSTAGSAAVGLWMQTDGNLVLYDGQWNAIWSTGTRGSGATYAILQAGGDFLLYTARGQAVWDTFQNTPEGILWEIANDTATPPGPTSAGAFLGYVPPRNVNTGGGGSSSGGLSFRTDVLVAGHRLARGEAIYSPSGCFFAVMQTDGNFVVYDARGGQAWVIDQNADGHWYGPALFASNTRGSGAVFAAFQGDGNFVLYDAAGRSVWSTATAGQGGTYLIMQNDGDLVLYGADGRAIWSSFSRMSPPIGPGIDLSQVSVNGRTCAQAGFGGGGFISATPINKVNIGNGRVKITNPVPTHSFHGGPRQTGGIVPIRDILSSQCLIPLAYAISLIDTQVCAGGTAVTVIHGFQQAFNAANPMSPINQDGIYTDATAQAVSLLIGANLTPPSCSRLLR